MAKRKRKKGSKIKRLIGGAKALAGTDPRKAVPVSTGKGIPTPQGKGKVRGKPRSNNPF